MRRQADAAVRGRISISIWRATAARTQVLVLLLVFWAVRKARSGFRKQPRNARSENRMGDRAVGRAGERRGWPPASPRPFSRGIAYGDSPRVGVPTADSCAGRAVLPGPHPFRPRFPTRAIRAGAACERPSTSSGRTGRANNWALMRPGRVRSGCFSAPSVRTFRPAVRPKLAYNPQPHGDRQNELQSCGQARAG